MRPSRSEEPSVAGVFARAGPLFGVNRTEMQQCKPDTGSASLPGARAAVITRGGYQGSGRYCIGFGGKRVGQGIGDALLSIVAPQGIERR